MGATTALALGLGRLELCSAPAGVAAGASPPAYGDWRDLYRQRLAWDRRVRCTHAVNCWYQRNCAWDVYVKDGLVIREEQAGAYPQVSPEVPDFNPRGCQKGACYSELLYAPDRLLHPLVRVGPRGSGRWRRASWDEALTRVADAILDALASSGSESIVVGTGGSCSSATWRQAIAHLFEPLDAVELDTNTELDDGQGGASITFGTPIASRSADDVFRSDLVLVWGANPVVTQIPNAHFLHEARYRGARLVTISPDHSPSAIHADLWLPIRPGTDAALALGLAREMLVRGCMDEAFVRDQTDLALLVKEDGRFLRQSDLEAGGADDRFTAFDTRSGRVVAVPHDRLEWGEAEPALTGRYTVETLAGPVSVRPVLDVLRERLDRDYPLDRVAGICGAPLGAVRELADWVCGARAMAGIAGSCIPKLYHGDLIMRAQLLVFVLGGHLGRPGAGFDTCPMMVVDGRAGMQKSQAQAIAQKMRIATGSLGARLRGETHERFLYELVRDYFERSRLVSSTLYWHEHGGLSERSEPDWGRNLPRAVSSYVEESYAQGWQKPPPRTPPRVLFLAGSNLLRRLRSSDLLLRNVWPKLDLVVVNDVRMSSTCRHADVLLPGTTSYEKDDVTNWFTLLSPYLHITQAAVPPVGESRTEWEIFARLAEAIERRAAERGITSFRDRRGEPRRLDDLVDRYTLGGRFGPDAQSAVAKHIVSRTSFVSRSFDELRTTGFERVREIGGHPTNLGNATVVRPDAPIVNRELRRTHPAPWPTLTGRIQFYIDHPLFLELGEELPAHKDPPRPGGDHPIVLSGGHTRWSIHALWRHVPALLRLQRGEAVAMISTRDARERGVADGDRIRVWNDVGTFEVQARVAPSMRPGVMLIYHAWEDHQFPGGRGYRNVIPSPLNPVELAGGYRHLRPVPASLQPGQSDRETRVDFAAAGAGALSRATAGAAPRTR